MKVLFKIDRASIKPAETKIPGPKQVSGEYIGELPPYLIDRKNIAITEWLCLNGQRPEYKFIVVDDFENIIERLKNDKNASVSIYQDLIDIKTKEPYEYTYIKTPITCPDCGHTFEYDDMFDYDDEYPYCNDRCCPECKSFDFEIEFESISDIPKDQLPAIVDI